MPLQPGDRLGPYEIVSALGAGGMGEVYRARDPRLRRDVAIKVLPTAFSADADRLHRFEQEARAAAALNHPNILAVHDIGIEGTAPFIVSELLEGATLGQRLIGGAIPVRKAIAYAIAIARGLAAAHEKAIIHRDLKPENVFITTDDRVKILDFGLTKLTDERLIVEPASALQTAPPRTEPGLVLGTVGYMAPEQVRGLPVDHRADLFAFGAILYEVLAGQRAFRRDTAPETMTAILNEHPPDLLATNRPIPQALARIVDRCLEKSPPARFQTATDLAFALEALSDASASAKAVVGHDRASTRRGWIGWAAAALMLATLAPVAVQHLRERTPAATPVRFEIPSTVELAVSGNVGLSPDGRHLAFLGLGSDGVARLWIRETDSLEVRPLPGSETSSNAPPFFWSPDSRFIAFDAGGKLKKLDVHGGPAQLVCDLPGTVVGGSWNRDGDIIMGNVPGGLLRVSQAGGTASPLTTLDESRKEDMHLLPSFLADGRHFVYLRVSGRTPETSGTYIGSIDAKPSDQNRQQLMPYAIGLTYTPSNDGGPDTLLFVREGTLVAQPFDARRLRLAGDPAPVAEHVGSYKDSGFFSTSATGMLVYRTVDSGFQVTWTDRTGTVSGRVSEPGPFRGVALSPDGARAVASRTNPQDSARADLWLLDLSRRGATRFTSGDVAEFPLWSPDGKRIAFVFKSTLYQKAVSGEQAEQELLPGQGRLIRPTSWSADGRFLMYAATDLSTRWDLWVLPMDDAVRQAQSGGNVSHATAKPAPFMRTGFDEQEGRFSPHGRWVAYVSNESGVNEVYVRALAADFSSGSASTGTSVLVSRGGGSAPRWRGDGNELFYLASDGKMMSVEMTAGQDFRAGTPAPLFPTTTGTIVGDVTADGKRLLLVTPIGQRASAPFTMVLNWKAALKK